MQDWTRAPRATRPFTDGSWTEFKIKLGSDAMIATCPSGKCPDQPVKPNCDHGLKLATADIQKPEAWSVDAGTEEWDATIRERPSNSVRQRCVGTWRVPVRAVRESLPHRMRGSGVETLSHLHQARWIVHPVIPVIAAGQ